MKHGGGGVVGGGSGSFGGDGGGDGAEKTEIETNLWSLGSSWFLPIRLFDNELQYNCARGDYWENQKTQY